MGDTKSISSYLSSKAPLTSRSKTAPGTVRGNPVREPNVPNSNRQNNKRHISSAHSKRQSSTVAAAIPPLPLPTHMRENTKVRKTAIPNAFLDETGPIHAAIRKNSQTEIRTENEKLINSATRSSLRSVSTTSTVKSSEMPQAIYIPSKKMVKDPRALPIGINKYKDIYEYATNDSDQLAFAAMRAKRADEYLAKQHKRNKKLDDYKDEWQEIKKLTKIQKNKERLAKGGEIDDNEEDDQDLKNFPSEKEYLEKFLKKTEKTYMKTYDGELPIGGTWEYSRPRRSLHAVKSYTRKDWTLKYKPPVIKLPDDNKNFDNDGEVQYNEDGEEIDNYDIPVDFGRLKLGETDSKSVLDPAEQVLRKLHKKMALVVGKLSDVNKNLKRVNIERETDYETIMRRERRRRKVPAHIRMAREGKVIAEQRGKKFQKYEDIKGTNQGGSNIRPFIPVGRDALKYHHEDGDKVQRLKCYMNWNDTLLSHRSMQG